jgi:D-alanyl-D-alanine dipeptidase
LVWRSAAAAGLSGPHFPSSGHKSTAGEIEIGKREEREYLRTVLGDAAIANLAVADWHFSNPEHVY